MVLKMGKRRGDINYSDDDIYDDNNGPDKNDDNGDNGEVENKDLTIEDESGFIPGGHLCQRQCCGWREEGGNLVSWQTCL